MTLKLSLNDTAYAREALMRAMDDPEVRISVTRFAPGIISDSERSVSLVKALQNAKVVCGLSTLLDVERFHPKEVIEELITGVLRREGDVAVHFAAMLFFLYCKSSKPFDMKQRSFFLRFNTDNSEERVKVFRELCEIIGINSDKFLNANKRRHPQRNIPKQTPKK